MGIGIEAEILAFRSQMAISVSLSYCGHYSSTKKEKNFYLILIFPSQTLVSLGKSFTHQ